MCSPAFNVTFPTVNNKTPNKLSSPTWSPFTHFYAGFTHEEINNIIINTLILFFSTMKTGGDVGWSNTSWFSLSNGVMVGHVTIWIKCLHHSQKKKKQLLVDPFAVNQGDLNHYGCTAEHRAGPPSAAKPHWVLKGACMENRPSFFFFFGRPYCRNGSQHRRVGVKKFWLRCCLEPQSRPYQRHWFLPVLASRRTTKGRLD